MTSSTASTVISFSTSQKAQVDKVAKQMGTTKSHVINQALNNYIDLYEWQEEQIKQGLADAKAKRFYKSDWRNLFDELRTDVKAAA